MNPVLRSVVRNTTGTGGKHLQAEDVIQIYRDLARVPSISWGRIGNLLEPGHIQIHTTWTQRDLERSENIKFVKDYLVQLDVVIPTPPVETSNVVWDIESPSGIYRAVVRKVSDKKGTEKEYVEVWSGDNKEQSINVTGLEKHGKIHGPDGHFGCLEWSSCEGQLLYVAEKKRPKTKSFFERKKVEDEGIETKEEPEQGKEYDFNEDWGEQYVDKGQPIVCVLDIDTGIVGTIDNLPESLSVGQASWCPGETGIVCVGYEQEPYRLGMIYCPIRKSCLYHVDFKSASCDVIGSESLSVRSPIFSPDGTKIVYLQNQAGGPHMQCSQIMLYDWENKTNKVLVDIVDSAPADEFQGFYDLKLNRRCWSSDSKRILFQTYWRSKVELVVVNVESGKITRLTNDDKVGAWTLLDVNRDLVLAAGESPSQPQYLVFGTLPSDGKESSIKWTHLDKNIPDIQQVSWRIISVEPEEERLNKKYGAMDYECVYLEPSDKSVRDKAPLVILPHGGPHTTFPAGFFVQFSGFCASGFKCLMVNYRGSLGFGQNSVISLPGNIGTQDVQDVQAALEHVIKEGLANKDQVVVTGGSHGGFLTTHLIGQYPDCYKAAASRNPVVNIVSMLGTSDIPDWCLVEGGFGVEYDFKQCGSDIIYKELYARSPIRHIDKVKTPLMIQLGADDRRVPPKQGHEFIRGLKARNVPCRLLVYPDNCHPIIKTESEADAFVNIVLWFFKYLYPDTS